MKFKVIPTDKFKKQAKRLVKKYASLKTELAELGSILQENSQTGTPLGNNAFKVRLAVKSKGKGKSGGVRIITYLVTAEAEIYLLTIYDKAEISTLNDKEIRSEINQLLGGKG